MFSLRYLLSSAALLSTAVGLYSCGGPGTAGILDAEFYSPPVVLEKPVLSAVLAEAGSTRLQLRFSMPVRAIRGDLTAADITYIDNNSSGVSAITAVIDSDSSDGILVFECDTFFEREDGASDQVHIAPGVLEGRDGAGLDETTATVFMGLGSKPQLLQAVTLDADRDGLLDHYRLVFSSRMLDATFPGYRANQAGAEQSSWLVAGHTNVVLAHGTSAPESDVINDNILYLQFDQSAESHTGSLPEVTTSASAGLLDFDPTPLDPVGNDDVSEEDGAAPVLWSATASPGSALLALVFSEPVYAAAGSVITASLFGYSDNSASDASSVSSVSDADGTDGSLALQFDQALSAADQVDVLSVNADSLYDAAGRPAADQQLNPRLFYWPDTGQNFCATGDGNDTAVTCGNSPVGQDAEYSGQPNSRSFSLTDSGDTVTDANTGLVWQRCLANYSGVNCLDPVDLTSSGCSDANSCTFAEAQNYCSSLTTGAHPWRLPTARDLVTVLYYGDGVNNSGNFNHYHDPAYFNMPTAGYYDLWTSSSEAGYPASAFKLQSGDGIISASDKGNLHNVRCVAGAQVPDPVYTDNGDGTVSESLSSLMYTRCPLGKGGSDCSTGSAASRTWQQALGDCEALATGGHTDWRLPSINELAVLINFEHTIGTAVIDSSFFPQMAASWSSTTSVSFYGTAFLVRYDSGSAFVGSGNFKTNSEQVICVRGQ